MTDEARFTQAVLRASKTHPEVIVHLSWGQICVLIGQLQLALRHPGQTNLAAARLITRNFLEQLIGAIEGVDAELAALLRRGDDPACDVRLTSKGNDDDRKAD